MELYTFHGILRLIFEAIDSLRNLRSALSNLFDFSQNRSKDGKVLSEVYSFMRMRKTNNRKKYVCYNLHKQNKTGKKQAKAMRNGINM